MYVSTRNHNEQPTSLKGTTNFQTFTRTRYLGTQRCFSFPSSQCAGITKGASQKRGSGWAERQFGATAIVCHTPNGEQTMAFAASPIPFENHQDGDDQARATVKAKMLGVDPQVRTYRYEYRYFNMGNQSISANSSILGCCATVSRRETGGTWYAQCHFPSSNCKFEWLWRHLQLVERLQRVKCMTCGLQFQFQFQSDGPSSHRSLMHYLADTYRSVLKYGVL